MLFLKVLPSLCFLLSRERSANNYSTSHFENSAVTSRTITSLDATTSATTSNEDAQQIQKTTLEVCLSPGCKADGAERTLLKLQALATEDVLVVPGVCCSLCGNGPIVMDTTTQKKYRKVVSSSIESNKILEVLLLTKQDDDDDTASSSTTLDPDRAAVLEGFNLVVEGDAALEQKKYSQAIEKYDTAMVTGLEAALTLEKRRREASVSTSESLLVPPQGLVWVIQAKCNEARAKLALNDSEGAMIDAESAFQLSRNTYAPSLQLLQEACQAKGDGVGELEALQALFDLPEPSKMTAMEANKRRSLSFRLSKLQATIKIP